MNLETAVETTDFPDEHELSIKYKFSGNHPAGEVGLIQIFCLNYFCIRGDP